MSGASNASPGGARRSRDPMIQTALEQLMQSGDEIVERFQ